MLTRLKPYLIIATLAFLTYVLGASSRYTGRQTLIIVIPVICWTCRLYGRYLVRLKDEKKRVEEMAGLHLRTIEALALAIDGKNFKRNQFQRVTVYAIEIGRKLGLSEAEMQALHAAALLHDIGKLAVPEHILSKPGRLSPMEFEKMRIHPRVGAEILEQVKFPYAVAPIVRSHHEKWDGTGYPDGLRGEAIPIGARILAAVDCLDALASDRSYRKAIPLTRAIAQVAAESGKSFDPQVVDVLANCYATFEWMMEADAAKRANQPVHAESERRGAAAAIAAARQEAQTLFELMHELGNSLSLDDTFSLLALSLQRVCPYDCIAFYIRQGDKLVPEFVNGENFHLFSSLQIPIGEGLSGWVAENREPIVNGNPSVESGYLDDASKFSTLRSALAVPLEGPEGIVGVLTLYHVEKDAFTRDHLRILLALTHKVALAIENALRYRQVETCAVTDGLTGLPNARSLFLHLDGEIARCKRDNSLLTILVCDLNGFKLVNDRFGHIEGNAVLRTVARKLRESCREYDYVARLGGDEFVVVLPGHLAEAVEAKIRLFSEIAAQAGRRLPCDEDMLSMSVGEANFPADGSDSEQLLAAADRRMYRAKHHFRVIAGSRDFRSFPGREPRLPAPETTPVY